MSDLSGSSKNASGCITVLFLITGVLAALQIGTVVNALRMPPELAAQVSIPAALEAVFGVLWAALFVWETVAINNRRRETRLLARRWALGTTAVFIVYTVARLLIFARADYDRQRWPFLLISGLLILIIPMSYIVQSVRAKKAPSTEAQHEREPKED